MIKDGATETRPVIALAMGDPAGISPELTARIIALPEIREAAHLVVIGDRRCSRGRSKGSPACDSSLASAPLDSFEQAGKDRHVFIDLAHLNPADVVRGEATLAGGTFATTNFRTALKLADSGRAHAVCFTPFNKKAMRYAYSGYDDEIRFVADVIGFTGKAREFNVLERVWNARVTSHIPLAEVASALSVEGIVAELALTQACLKSAGRADPRIIVAGLNPHAGDGGNFGTEEIGDHRTGRGSRAKRPASTSRARSLPIPSFCAHSRKSFTPSLTMYHDQGQIAMKLIGLRQGRDHDRWPAVPAVHAGPRHGLRHRWKGHRRCRRQPRGVASGGAHGQEGCSTVCCGLASEMLRHRPAWRRVRAG